MFGLSFSELLVVLTVAMVVLGPKELPRYLRKAGQFAGRLRRMAYDMREKSGIDEILRTEGIDRDIAEIRRLTRGELTGIIAAVRSTTNGFHPVVDAIPVSDAAAIPPAIAAPAIIIHREREYPSDGADAYGALPDTAAVYEGTLVPSPLADDPVYANGAPPEASVAEARS